MKRIYTIIACLLLSIGLKAQINLVPNGSFEQFDTCMMSAGTVFRAVGWENVVSDVEYLNSCANISQPTYGVPQNGLGYQFAEDGYAYVVLALYALGNPHGGEIIGRQLSQPLVAGQKYYCSFYVSLVDSGGCPAINKIGMKFSMMDQGCQWCIVGPYNPSLYTNTSAIYTNTIITDKVNWTEISGWYVADSAYDYVMLGKFFDYAHTDTILGWSSGSFYYFDNVYVGLDSVSNYHEGISNINNFANKISIYPNPATTTLTIHDDIYRVEVLKLYDVYGNLLRNERTYGSQDYILNLIDLPTGVYILNVQGKNIDKINYKIIKF